MPVLLEAFASVGLALCCFRLRWEGLRFEVFLRACVLAIRSISELVARCSSWCCACPRRAGLDFTVRFAFRDALALAGLAFKS